MCRLLRLASAALGVACWAAGLPAGAAGPGRGQARVPATAPASAAGGRAATVPASRPAGRAGPPATRPASRPAGPASGPTDLADYRTVETAIRAASPAAGSGPANLAAQAGQTAYLGIDLGSDGRGRVVVQAVAPGSPAARAGLAAGDVLSRLNGTAPESARQAGDIIRAQQPGAKLAISVLRAGRPLELSAVLAALSRPVGPDGQRAYLGIRTGSRQDDGGIPVEGVVPRSPAERGGLRAGDVILAVDSQPAAELGGVADALWNKQPGQTVALTIRRGGKQTRLDVRLGAERPGATPARGPTSRSMGVFRLAVVCVEYPDVRHNPQIGAEDWQEAIFSKGTYADRTNSTGRRVFGSLNDYYLEQSCGSFRVEGKVFGWVSVSRNRAEYGRGTSSSDKAAFLTGALDVLLAREGKDALKDFDGLAFIYAGEAIMSVRGSLYWPHRGDVTHAGRRWGYIICAEGGRRMTSISVLCHEFGHLLGLPDLYARPGDPDSEGAGPWCAMSNQFGGGRPQHLSAWCKERLGWLRPTVIDPTVRQKLILSPVELSPRECFRVVVRPDGAEYLLLENRQRIGFDADLPGEGLLIWRVVRNRPVLQESHGMDGPAGPRAFLGLVPYPSAANDSFTPYTTPSSRSSLGGGLPVHITNIRRLSDGRIAFHVGYEYY